MKLYRQKEQLKKDILKKRIVLEKELQIEIQKELATELANRAKQEKQDRKKVDEAKVKETPPVYTKKRYSTFCSPSIYDCTKIISSYSHGRLSTVSAKKQAAEEAKNVKIKATIGETSRKSSATTAAAKAKERRKSHKAAGLSKKKEKLYCICRTPYDDSK